jgi:hypothetical protein
MEEQELHAGFRLSSPNEDSKVYHPNPFLDRIIFVPGEKTGGKFGKKGDFGGKKALKSPKIALK